MLTTARANMGGWSRFVHRPSLPAQPLSVSCILQLDPNLSCPQRFPTTYSQIHSPENPCGRTQASICLTEPTWPRNAETTWSHMEHPLHPGLQNWSSRWRRVRERERAKNPEPRFHRSGSCSWLLPLAAFVTSPRVTLKYVTTTMASPCGRDCCVCSLNVLPFPPGQPATLRFSASLIVREHHTTEFLPYKTWQKLRCSTSNPGPWKTPVRSSLHSLFTYLQLQAGPSRRQSPKPTSWVEGRLPAH